MKYIKTFENIAPEIKKYFVIHHANKDTLDYEIYELFGINRTQNNVSAVKLFTYHNKLNKFKRHTQNAINLSLFSIERQIIYTSDSLKECKDWVETTSIKNKFNI